MFRGWHLADVGLVLVGDLRKVDIRPLGKGNSNSHGARPVHQIISTSFPKGR